MAVLSCQSCVLILFVILNNIHGERIKDKMYSELYGASCIRRLNATHQTGCSSRRQGSVGALHLLETKKDLDWLLNEAPAPPYIPMLRVSLFSPELMLHLKNNEDKISGVLVLGEGTRSAVKAFSQESKCPNQFSGLSDLEHPSCDPNNSTAVWNPVGTNLLLEDYPFAIFYIYDEEEIKMLIACWSKYNIFNINNHSGSMCAVELNSFMAAAVNSEVCYRRSGMITNLSPVKFCDPLGDRNVYSTLFPLSTSSDFKSESGFEYEAKVVDSNKGSSSKDNSVDVSNGKNFASLVTRDRKEKIIMVLTKMDTTSMFDGVAPGAMDSVIPLVTILSVANMLSRLLGQDESNKYDTNVMYMVLNGESYDYIGSQRLVYDMENGDFPSVSINTSTIRIEHIDLLVEINGIGNNMWAHYPDNGTNVSRVQDFIKILNAHTKKDLNVTMAPEPKSLRNLPPASSQTFLKENSNIPAVILTDFQRQYKNNFYHSVLDDQYNIGYTYFNGSEPDWILTDLLELEYLAGIPSDSVQVLIRNVSTVIATALYREVTSKDYIGTLGTNPFLIDELIYCYLISADCNVFRAASPPDSGPALNEPPYRYVGVVGYENDATEWTARVLTLVTGIDQHEKNKSECQNLPNVWLRGFNGSGICVLSNVNYSQAVSPAFSEEDYDWSSGKYSTWSESTWWQFSARMFLRPSVAHQVTTVIIGTVVMLASFILIYWINKKTDVLFPNSGAAASTTDE